MTPRSRSIIYVEPSFDEANNQFIRDNIELLNWRAEGLGTQFVYLPRQIEEGVLQQELAYFYPNLSEAEVDEMVNQPDFLQQLYRQIAGRDIAAPQLVLRPSDDPGSASIDFPHGGNVDEAFGAIRRLAERRYAEAPIQYSRSCSKYESDDTSSCSEKHLGFRSIQFQICQEMLRQSEDNASEAGSQLEDVAGEICEYTTIHRSYCPDSAEIDHAIAPRHAKLDMEPLLQELEDEKQAEARQHIARLLELGLTKEDLEQIFRLHKPEVSRLVITPDLRIVLTDYQEREVSIPHLSKALFLLYLNHPEGIPFKCLCDHRQELINYYSRISPSTNLEKINSSIDALTNSTLNNSVHEKSSRIKHGFEAKIAPDLAQPYIIAKDKDGVQRIALDRKMVIDQADILDSLPH